MSFIGIITENRNEICVKKIIDKNIKEIKVESIIIKDKNIENMKNIKFETILICGNNTPVLEKTEVLKKIISNAKFLIINSDIDTNLNVLNNMNLTVISFGFNQKSSITASSVDDDSILVCVQRNIKDINQKIIEPQEIRVEIENKNAACNTHNLMGCICASLIYGKKHIVI